jgi:hypothetical protein
MNHKNIEELLESIKRKEEELNSFKKMQEIIRVKVEQEKG